MLSKKEPPVPITYCFIEENLYENSKIKPLNINVITHDREHLDMDQNRSPDYPH